jgi:hypothetical protein
MMNALMEHKPAANVLVAPVGSLVDTKDIDLLVKQLKAILEMPGDGVRFTGELAVYNPLIELAATDDVAFRAVVRLVMRKRASKNLPFTPLRALLHGETEAEKQVWKQEAESIKSEVNRGYVAEMRARLRRLVRIENMMRGPNDQLVGQKRLDFVSNMWSRWAQRRVAVLELAARNKPEGRLSRAEARKVLEDFRSTIDRELDEMERAARSRKRYATMN